MTIKIRQPLSTRDVATRSVEKIETEAVDTEDAARAHAAKQDAGLDGQILPVECTNVQPGDLQLRDTSKLRKAIDEYISSITDDLWALNIKVCSPHTWSFSTKPSVMTCQVRRIDCVA